MRLDEGEIAQRGAGHGKGRFPCPPWPVEFQHVPAAERKHVVDVAAGPEGDCPLQRRSRVRVGEHEGCRPVRYERAVGAAQGSRDDRILLGNGVAERKTEIPAHMRVRVGYAVRVVLGRDHRKFLGTIAVTLEVMLCNAAEDARKTAFDVGLLFPVAAAQKDVADLCRRNGGHFSAPMTSAMRPRPASMKSIAV